MNANAPGQDALSPFSIVDDGSCTLSGKTGPAHAARLYANDTAANTDQACKPTLDVRDMLDVERAFRQAEALRLPEAVMLAAGDTDRTAEQAPVLRTEDTSWLLVRIIPFFVASVMSYRLLGPSKPAALAGFGRLRRVEPNISRGQGASISCRLARLHMVPHSHTGTDARSGWVAGSILG